MFPQVKKQADTQQTWRIGLQKRLYLVRLPNRFFSGSVKDMELAHIKDHIRLISNS